MRGYIYQVAMCPIGVGGMADSVSVSVDSEVDYCNDLQGNERFDAIKSLVDKLKGLVRYDEDEDTLVYLGGWENVKEEILLKINDFVVRMSTDNMTARLHTLEKMAASPLDTGSLFLIGRDVTKTDEEEFFLSLFEGLRVGAKFYLGGVMTYHK